MPKIDLIVPHYHEDIALMNPMINILKLQRNVDFNDFRILIVCDGEDVVLPRGFGNNLPFRVKSITVPHNGISAARNAGLDASDAEWIMFCDSDDALMTTISMQTYLKFAANPRRNIISSAFYEEAPSYKDGKNILIHHSGDDYIFIHSKMFRRSWLKENNIRFHDDVKLHEDAYFVAIARYTAKEEEFMHVRDHLYLWQNNPNSVTRRVKNFVLETYDLLVKKNAALTDELLRRGMFVQAKGIVCRTITDAYCRLNSKSWNAPGNGDKIRDAEDSVALFYKHYEYIYKHAGDVVIQTGLNSLRDHLIKCGDFDESKVLPFDKWVDRLKEP